ncbi:MAG: sigma-70 family RNA polymerase sigma factor [Planctomycetota bacterium]|jgi:RNA polymerase sigma-70 factor (ECF subfamily)|nr:sigma-70 family RNA polymerase sigma factor [Blastopirellula sp.]
MASKVMSEPLHDESETRLIRAATAGDPEAFGRLVLMYQDRLVNSLFHLLGNQAEAEDVAQEAFVLAFLKLATFRGQSQFYTWLFRIARNLSVSRFRKARKTASLDAVESGGSQLLLSDEPAPDRQLLVEEAGTRVREALARLSEEHRAILILRELDELDYDAIAAALELPVGTVRSRLHRARLQLKAELEALETVTGSGTREKRTS